MLSPNLKLHSAYPVTELLIWCQHKAFPRAEGSPCTESELLLTHPTSVTLNGDGRHAAHLDGEGHAAEELARQRSRLWPEIREVSRVINLTSLIARRFSESIGNVHI